jgi:hypothetical protein
MERCDFPGFDMTMAALTPLEKLTVPLGGQQIELQQIEFVPGGMPMLRVRIREGKRFTVFDIDPATAARWGRTMAAWAATQTAVKE